MTLITTTNDVYIVEDDLDLSKVEQNFLKYDAERVFFIENIEADEETHIISNIVLNTIDRSRYAYTEFSINTKNIITYGKLDDNSTLVNTIKDRIYAKQHEGEEVVQQTISE